VSITGYKLTAADNRNGRRGDGTAMYVRSELRTNVLAKSPDVSSVNYLFVNVSFHGQRVLVGPMYNPPWVVGAPIYWHVLEDPYNILLGDFNIDLLSSSDQMILFLNITD
jgi:hypothetical protein